MVLTSPELILLLKKFTAIGLSCHNASEAVSPDATH